MSTIRAVAEEANVSPSTVSLVVNGRGRISSETRDRVVAVMERLGYSPRGAGRPLAASRTHRIGIVYPARVITHGVLSHLTRAWINGIRSSLEEAGEHLSVFGGARHSKDDLLIQQVVEAREVDGFILLGVTPDDGYLECVLPAALPTVVMDRTPKYGEFSHVSIDDFGGGRQAIRYLHDQGHRRVAMICSLSSDPDVADARRAGAEAAASELGISLASLAWVGMDDKARLKAACREVAASGATAVFITSDYPAAECIACWEADGVRVPTDLSVLGFDNLALRVGDGRKLSSIGFNKQRMGREAGAMMRSLLADDNEVVSKGLLIGTHVAEHDTVIPHHV